jgi:hypothetical protein
MAGTSILTAQSTSIKSQWKFFTGQDALQPKVNQMKNHIPFLKLTDGDSRASMEMTRRQFALTSASLIAGASLCTLPNAHAAQDDLSEDAILRFLIISDTHWGGYDDWRPERKEATIEAINKACAAHKTDFVLLNGDIIHHDPDNQIPEFQPDLKRFTVPIYMTHGNHDIMTDDQFIGFIGHPKDHHFTIRVHPRQYYAFILLDTYSAPPQVAYGNHSQGHICPNQAFLKEALDKYQDAAHVFIFAHRCPTDNVNCGDWLEWVRSRERISSFYGHAHTRWDSRNIQGKINHFGGHNTDKGNRRGWQAWHSYRVVEVTHRTIKTHVYDYTNEIVRNAYTILEPAQRAHQGAVCPE